MKLIALFISLLFLSCNSPLEDKKIPNIFEGKVVAVSDGDTYKVMFGGKERVIRLEHIDCPEKGQPFGTKAKKYASALCFGKVVKIIGKGKTDRYQRIVAEVYSGNICINKDLVKKGLAWHYFKYSDNIEYADLEKSARQKKIGIWEDANATPPWEWRKK